MRTAAVAALCLAVASLAGCSRASVMKVITPAEDESTARKYIELVRQRRFDQIERDMDPSLKSEDLGDTLVQMAAMFPAEQPVSTNVVGMRSSSESGSRSTNIALEYEFSNKWMLAEIATKKSDGVVSVVGLHITPAAESLDERYGLTFAGKGAAQYAIFFLAVLASGLNIYAFVARLRTRLGKKKKWFWAIATLVGVGAYGVDWTTGQSSFTPFSVHVGLPFAAVAPFCGPWVAWLSFPLGAILFLALRERMGRTDGKGDRQPQAVADGERHSESWETRDL